MSHVTSEHVDTACVDTTVTAGVPIAIDVSRVQRASRLDSVYRRTARRALGVEGGRRMSRARSRVGSAQTQTPPPRDRRGHRSLLDWVANSSVCRHRLRTCLSVGGLIAILGMAAPLPAATGPTPVAVVLAQPPQSSAAVDVLWATRLAVDARSDTVSVNVATYLGDGGDQSMDLDAGRAALLEGQQAMEDLELVRAIVLLERAALALGRARDEAGARAVEALDLLARAHAASRDERRAMRAYERLLNYDPDHRLESGSASPSVARAFEAAREARSKSHHGALTVVSSRRGAVFVDGRYAGSTPLHLEEIVAGPHDIAMEADGFGPDLQTVDIRRGRETEVRIELRRARKARIFDQITDQLPAQLREDRAGVPLQDLGAVLFAEQAIVLSQHNDNISAHLYDLRRGQRLSQTATHPIPRARDRPRLGRKLVSTLYTHTVTDPAPLLVPSQPAPRATPSVIERWWFWPTLAVVTVAAVGIPVWMATRSDDGGGLERDGETGAVLLTF